MQLTGTRSRTGSGQPSTAASSAAASQGADSASSYSGKGQNSPHPDGPSSNIPSRTVIPRNRVVSGIAYTVSARYWAGEVGHAP